MTYYTTSHSHCSTTLNIKHVTLAVPFPLSRDMKLSTPAVPLPRRYYMKLVTPAVLLHIFQLLYETSCARRDYDVQRRSIRGWKQTVYRNMIYSPETIYDIDFDRCDSLIIFILIDKDHLRMLTLCTLGPLHHAWLFVPSSSCSMLLLTPSLPAVDCLSRSLSGEPGPPSFPLPGLTPFLSGPRQHPTLLSGTLATPAVPLFCYFNIKITTPAVPLYLRYYMILV